VRAREAQVADQLVAAAHKAASDTAAAATAFRSTVEAQLDSAVRAGGSGDLFTALEADVQVFERVLAAAAASVGRAATVAEDAIKRHQGAILERHALQEAEYRKTISEFEEEGGRAAERVALQGSLGEAVNAAKQQAAKEAQRQELRARRGELLGRMSELRDRRFAARKRVAERLTQQLSSIRVTVTQAADSQQYRDLIAKALKGSAIKQNVAAERLAEVFLPMELSRAVVNIDIAVIAARTGFDDERSRKVADALRADGCAYEIESVDLEDVPRIELLDGGKYKQSPNLSTGQRCTTILPILLVQSERPLLIDQPEDNLDNAFIYDTIVQALRAAKGARQVIFVTHNPNIPVLGEADRVFVFESDGHHAKLRRMGNVDECKEDIETILEGGREAFLQRKARYGH
jgi:ABC-type molybdenum transport system ATPase subunit/photorepair protein PhrA